MCVQSSVILLTVFYESTDYETWLTNLRVRVLLQRNTHLVFVTPEHVLKHAHNFARGVDERTLIAWRSTTGPSVGIIYDPKVMVPNHRFHGMNIFIAAQYEESLPQITL